MGTPPFPPIEASSIEEELRSRLPSLFSADFTVAEVKKAFGHQTFRIESGRRTYLLKVARQPAEVARLRAVAESVALARSAGVRAPDVVAVAPATPRLGGRPYLVQEYWPGRDAEEAWSTLSGPAREALVRAWGREVALLHQAPADRFTEGAVKAGEERDWGAHLRNRISKLVRYNEKAAVLGRPELDRVRAALRDLIARSAHAVAPALVHRDLCLRNVLVDGDSRFAALLDFEHARLSDPVMDFVKLRLWLFERDPMAEAAFQSGYRDVQPRELPFERERYGIALALELLGEIPYYKRNASIPALEEATRRLREWLARSGQLPTRVTSL